MKTMIGSNLSADQLRSVIERIEKLMDEKAAISADISDVFAEAKGNGYDVTAIRKIIKLRSMDAAKRDEDDAVLETYKRAIGLLPLFEDEGEAA